MKEEDDGDECVFRLPGVLECQCSSSRYEEFSSSTDLIVTTLIDGWCEVVHQTDDSELPGNH